MKKIIPVKAIVPAYLRDDVFFGIVNDNHRQRKNKEMREMMAKIARRNAVIAGLFDAAIGAVIVFVLAAALASVM